MNQPYISHHRCAIRKTRNTTCCSHSHQGRSGPPRRCPNQLMRTKKPVSLRWTILAQLREYSSFSFIVKDSPQDTRNRSACFLILFSSYHPARRPRESYQKFHWLFIPTVSKSRDSTVSENDATSYRAMIPMYNESAKVYC